MCVCISTVMQCSETALLENDVINLTAWCVTTRGGKTWTRGPGLQTRSGPGLGPERVPSKFDDTMRGPDRVHAWVTGAGVGAGDGPRKKNGPGPRGRPGPFFEIHSSLQRPGPGPWTDNFFSAPRGRAGPRDRAGPGREILRPFRFLIGTSINLSN